MQKSTGDQEMLLYTWEPAMTTYYIAIAVSPGVEYIFIIP
jgi:hypothetical protein